MVIIFMLFKKKSQSILLHERGDCYLVRIDLSEEGRVFNYEYMQYFFA